MSELEELIDALDAIHDRRESSYVVLAVEGREGLYAEVWAHDHEPGLTAEIVGNEELRPTDQLTPEQEAAMRDLGWEGDGVEMWRRAWPATPTRADRQRVAYETLRALGEVYGATGAVRVEEVGLGETPVEAKARETTNLVVALVVSGLVMVIAVAVLVFFAAG